MDENCKPLKNNFMPSNLFFHIIDADSKEMGLAIKLGINIPRKHFLVIPVQESYEPQLLHQ